MGMAGVHTAVVARGQRTFVPNRRFATFGFNNFHHIHHFHNGTHFFFNTCFNTFGSFGGFGCSSPFFGAGLWGAGLWGPGIGYPGDPFYSGYYNQPQQQEPQQQPVTVENDSNNREIAFEMQALRDEIQAMRQEQHARDEVRNAPPSRPAAQQDDGNAVLVFRDGRQLAVSNYAVADHTIWVLGPNSARRVPVSELDLPATEQANAKNGVEFRLPH
jgi:hypothetical protein